LGILRPVPKNLCALLPALRILLLVKFWQLPAGDGTLSAVFAHRLSGVASVGRRGLAFRLIRFANDHFASSARPDHGFAF
jgi:hypothetical protein